MDISLFHHTDDHDNDTEVMCGMDMSFHWGACEFILWRSWQANTVPKFVMACIGFFLMAFLYEALKFFREAYFIQTQTKIQRMVKSANGEIVNVKLTTRQQMINMPHFYQTLLQGLQVFTSYILMLIVMLCNLYLIFSIVLGASLGYFTFGWMRRPETRCKDTDECCY